MVNQGRNVRKKRAQVRSTSLQQTYDTTSFIQGKSTTLTQSDVTFEHTKHH
jgi:hypothetical protein